MTTLTYRTPPAPIRAHLHRSHTTCHHADARIEQAFYPTGWANVPGQPFPSPGAIRQLRDRGATCIAVGYNRPHTDARPRADFTIRECLS